ncbi:hypothetical protein [Phenylobacterium sp. 58.2.17]|uniref:hypothetical protein n=1 Tax=Phenylobacterium sp. 58.2.17 TaxID=2969306 RepID=UPI002264BDB7|nr:hypothetical protein [Phenylobacterium sp. 58.2.17]MCX7587179.1 hypothetical protein [Phenylobacterium sp. 58.2.17]
MSQDPALAELAKIRASADALEAFFMREAPPAKAPAPARGLTLDELREVADPRLWKILHRAQLGDEAAKQRETTRQTEQLQAVRPAVQVSGAGASRGGVRDELGTREWMQRRNDQALRAR